MEGMKETDSGKRLLLVEDDPGQQIQFKALLNRISRTNERELKLEVVSSAEEALERFESTYKETNLPYDMVLSDISLEGQKSGVDLREICKMKYPRMGFVLTSGKSVDEYAALLGNPDEPVEFISKFTAPGAYRRALEEFIFDTDLPAEPVERLGWIKRSRKHKLKKLLADLGPSLGMVSRNYWIGAALAVVGLAFLLSSNQQILEDHVKTRLEVNAKQTLEQVMKAEGVQSSVRSLLDEGVTPIILDPGFMKHQTDLSRIEF